MTLLTTDLRRRLPPLYANEAAGDDALVVAKFFTPDAQWTWYATEFDPESRTFYGFVRGLEAELGYFSLDDLERVRGPLGLPVERDRWWRPVPLRAVRTGAAR